MSELDKAVEVLNKEINELPYYYISIIEPVKTVVSTIEQLRDKVNKDIEELEFDRDMDSERGYGEDLSDKAVREYAESIKEIIGG